MPRNSVEWGNWNAICDICGFKFKASEMRKKWDGTMVCKQDYEIRHPQDFLRVRGDKPSVPWARPEPDDDFVSICYIWGRSAYADLAEADCMVADYAPLPFLELYELKWGLPYPLTTPSAQASGIPGYAIPGYAIPGVTFTGVPF